VARIRLKDPNILNPQLRKRSRPSSSRIR